MFVFGISDAGLVDLKVLLDKPLSFAEAESVVFQLVRAKAFATSSLARARVENLLAQAQRRRREAGNNARFA